MSDDASKPGSPGGLDLELLRALTDNSEDILSLLDADGRLLFNSAAAARISGFSPEELAGLDTFTNMHPDDRARVQAAFSRVLAAPGNREMVQYRYRKKSGGWSWMEAVATNRLHDPAVRGVVANSRDISERRALESKLELVSHLSALGTLVAGLAHELNNPLAIASISLDLAFGDLETVLRRLEAPSNPGAPTPAPTTAELERVREGLLDVKDATGRIARIVHDLVTFSNPRTPATRVELSEVVHAALRWLRKSVPPSVELAVIDRRAPPVLGSQGQLGQVVLNLVANAVRAIPPGRAGHVTITTGPGSGGRARLEVRDDGVGVNPDVVERIFDPFFTTEPVGQGMGLGLAVTHALVTAHGGTITLDTAPGAGSTFTVELPAADAAQAPTVGAF